MKKSRVFVCLFVFVLTLSCISVFAQEIEMISEVPDNGAPLLVVPVRHTIVKLAFDINALRDVSLVSCTVDQETGDTLVHLWNNVTREWSGVTIAEYKIGTIFPVVPSKVYIIGSEDGVPADLGDVSEWGKTEVVNVPELSISAILNTLNKDMKFNTKEWKWLGARYNLVLKDLNEDRRRYGRYGKPSKTKKEEQVDAPEMMMPPEVIEESSVTPKIEDVPAVPVMEEEKPKPVEEEVREIVAKEKPEPVKVAPAIEEVVEDIPPEDK